MHDYDEGVADDARDRRDIADEIEVELLIKRRIDGVVRCGKEEGIAIWGSADDRLGAEIGAAPGLFSTMNGWPSRSDSHWPITRATMSVAPPGASGTMRRTGRRAE